MANLDRAPTLAEIGEALYGEYWQRPMARDLGKGLRTVHRWAVADQLPREAVMRRLIELLERRQAWTAELIAAMREE